MIRSRAILLLAIGLVAADVQAQVGVARPGREARSADKHWRVEVDPAPDEQFSPASIDDVSIALTGPAGDWLIPKTPSHFVAHAVRRESLEVTCWDLRSGEVAGRLRFAPPTVVAPALSPDGKVVAIATVGREPTVTCWSLADQRQLARLDLGDELFTVQLLALAGNNRVILETVADGAVRLFDATNGKLLARISCAPVKSRAVTVSPGGRYLSLAAPTGVQIWDCQSGSLVNELSAEDLVTPLTNLKGIQFSHDGEELALLLAGTEPSVVCFSLKTGKVASRIALTGSVAALQTGVGTRDPLVCVPGGKGWLLPSGGLIGRDSGIVHWFSPRRQDQVSTAILALDANRLLQFVRDERGGRLSLTELPWDELSKQAALRNLGGQADDLHLPPLTAADRSRAREVSLRGVDRQVKVPADGAPAWDRPVVEPIAVPVSALEVRECLLAPGAGKAIVSALSAGASASGGHPRRELIALNLATGRQEAGIRPGFDFEVLDVSIDGRQVLLASPGRRRLDIFDLAIGRHWLGLRPFSGTSTEQRIADARLLPGGLLLTRDQAGVIECWQLPQGQAIYSLKGLPEQPLILSPGRRQMVVHDERRCHFVAAHTGELIASLPRPVLPRDFFPRQAAFHGRGSLLATVWANEDSQRLIVWDLEQRAVTANFLMPPANSLIWQSESHVLAELPRQEATEPRLLLLDLALQRPAWEYRIPRGVIAPGPAGERLCFLTFNQQRGQAELLVRQLPAPETAAQIVAAPLPANLLARGSKVRLLLSWEGLDGKLNDKWHIEELQKTLSAKLAARGVRVDEAAALELKVACVERLSDETLERSPNLAGKPRATIRGAQMQCTAEWRFGDAVLLSRHSSFEPEANRLERVKTPVGSLLDEARRQVFAAAQRWLADEAIPAQLYPDWALTGIGQSTLTAVGESEAALKKLD